MDRPLKSRLSTRSSHKIEESEKMDVCDASSINGNTTSDRSDMNKTTRTNDSVILVLSDDEDFAGFGVYNNGKRFIFFNVTIII